MDAFAAVAELEAKINELETVEPSWRNCRACPFAGKCCDGASLMLFPEERASISNYLVQNPEVLSYALSRFDRAEKCYFYDKQSSKCRIHDVRPLNCRWTPYTAFLEDGGRHSVHVRDAECNFTHNILPAHAIRGNAISLDPLTLKAGSNKTYLLWQSIQELHPLMRRADEMTRLEALMLSLANQPATEANDVADGA